MNDANQWRENLYSDGFCQLAIPDDEPEQFEYDDRFDLGGEG